MSDFSPLVSVVIPAYNSSRYICETIDSCLAQTYPHVEIIVVDDGSTDGTGDLVQGRYGEKIRYFYQANQGPGIARNRGVQEALGEFIQFCDSDDQLLPTKIERAVEVFAQHGEDVAVAYSRIQYVGEDGRTPLYPPAALIEGELLCKMLRNNGNLLQLGTTMIRREAFLSVDGFRDNKDFRCAEDWDLFMRLVSQYRFVGLDEVLTIYRQRPTGISNNRFLMAYGRLLAIQYARNLPGRERCMKDSEFNRLEAERHHVLAMVYWEQDQRAEARDHFQAALRLTPSAAMARRVLIAASYVLSESQAERLLRLFSRG